MNWINVFMERLDNLLEERGLNPRNFCRELGLFLNTISKYKAGKSRPNVETLINIAKYFNVSVDYLIGNSDIRYFEENIDKALNVRKIQESAKVKLIEELKEYIQSKES